MGMGTWTSKDWSSYTKRKGYTSKSSVTDMYTAFTIDKALEPKGVDYREARDSTEHPCSTPIILGLDVTGSMGNVLETISKKLNTLITEIYNRNPVTDPQVMIMAFGDVECDKHPLQVTQFESDIRIAEQLNRVYFERGGGGNDGESYTLPWYFAARHTKTDQYEKRNKKGFLFTIGDEKYLPILSKEAIKNFIGDKTKRDLEAKEILTEVSRQYEVYHLMIEEGNGMQYNGGKERNNVVIQWTNLLGQHAICVSDCTKIPEIIVSILEIAAGKEKEEVIDSWDKSTSLVVKDAVSHLTAYQAEQDLIQF